MTVYRKKPVIRISCDFAENFRFQECRDIDAAAGAWLRCLAYSTAQELGGRVNRHWLRRGFPGKRFQRVEELVRVGLLRVRDDGDYELLAEPVTRDHHLRDTRAVTRDTRGSDTGPVTRDTDRGASAPDPGESETHTTSSSPREVRS
jgi:hypothetical protein